MSRKKVAPALRVTQLDTLELDRTAIQLLSSQLQTCFKYKLFKYDLMQAEPYFRTAMYSALLYSTLWKNGQTIGQKLLRIRYGSGKNLVPPSSRRLLFVQGILILQFWMDASKSMGRLWSTDLKIINIVTKFIESSYDFLTLANYLVFLRQGFFHTLLHRVAGLRSVFVDPNPRLRNISYELMSRDILWQGFAETGVFFLSLLNISKIRRKASELLFRQSDSDEQQESFDCCGFCKQIPVMPYVGACKKHAFCYYCVSSAFEKDKGLKCQSCSSLIEKITPLECREIAIS